MRRHIRLTPLTLTLIMLGLTLIGAMYMRQRRLAEARAIEHPDRHITICPYLN